jgi:hypothetical protein
VRSARDLAKAAARADSRGEASRAEQMFKDVIAGFRHMLGPTHEETARAVYQISTFYANHSRMPDADSALNWLSERYIEREGLSGKNTLVHFLRVIELLQSWNRQDHAEVVIYKVLRDWPEIEDVEEPFKIPSAGTVVPEDADNILNYHEAFEDTDSPEEVDHQLRVVDLWMSAKLNGAEQILTKLITQCERHRDRLAVHAIKAKCSLARIYVDKQEPQVASSVLKDARKGLRKLLKDDPGSYPLVDLSRKVAFLHIQGKMDDHNSCNAILSYVASQLESAATSRNNMRPAEIALNFMIQVGIDFQVKTSWRLAKSWFERALGFANLVFGSDDERTVNLEETLANGKFNYSGGSVDDLMKATMGPMTITFM